MTEHEVTVERPAAPVVTPALARELELAIRQMPDQFTEDQLTAHHFCAGLYAREFYLPAGAVVVGKTHAKESFFLMIRGEASFSTADGTVQRIRAPYMAVTQPGSKRVVLAHEDTVFLTFHPNPDDVQNLEILEQRFIIPEALPAPEVQEKLT